MEIVRKQPEPIEDIVVITMSLEEARALLCFVAEHNRASVVQYSSKMNLNFLSWVILAFAALAIIILILDVVKRKK